MHIECGRQSFKSKPRVPTYADGLQSRNGFVRARVPGRHDALTFIPLFILALPIIEIAVFILVGSKIGVLWTIALVILSALAGSMAASHPGLWRAQPHQGRTRCGARPRPRTGAWRHDHARWGAPADPRLRHRRDRPAAFHPAGARCRLAFPQAAHRSQRLVFSTGFGGFRNRTRDDRTIDLDAEDYSRTPDRKSPWRIGTDD